MPLSQSSSAAEGAVDLSNCDREPIHILGAIQPFGVLLAVTADWIVSRASANVGAVLGREAADLLGVSLNEVLAPGALHDLRNAMTLLRGEDAVERLFGLDLLGDGRRFDLAVHRSGDEIVLECEPSEAQGEASVSNVVRGLMRRLQGVTSLRTLWREAARQMQALSGFERVMVYRFHEDGSGEVVAEAVPSTLEPFLGLRYPASDIPRQARALYLRNWLRIIADVDSEPVPIVPPRNLAGEPLDLSMSGLRTVSPIHLEYLRNMGVTASMSVSIISGGRLWGLFACHHSSPRRLSFERRTAVELFAQMFSFLLDARERDEGAEYEAGARKLHNQLMAAMATRGSAFDNASGLADTMADLIPCDGFGVFIEGQITLRGSTPTAEEFLGLVRFLNRAPAGAPFATDEIGRLHEPGRDFAERAAGMLAIPVSRLPRDYIVFFRREVAQAVTWAGNPEKPATLGPNGLRLTPRKSFEAWREVVHGRSNPWTRAELQVAETLRLTLLEVVLRLADVADKERKAAAERQELLIGELNHRVRNILGLVRGLVTQSRSDVTSVEEFARVLGGRVQALARAHDQITSQHWGPAPLRALIETEAAAYLNDKSQRVHLSGPDVLLHPQAFSTLSLVIHELMTNSAKYGALTDRAGNVTVTWALDTMERLALDWVEEGGPAVRAPTRRGFGSLIIERAIPHDLQGEARVDYALAGLRAHFAIPASLVELQKAPPAAAADPAAPPRRTRLAGDVLLVEDNMIIALDAESMLDQLGARRIVTASSVGDALRQLEASPPAFALLDVNLGDATSFPVADALRARGIPFAFATGYGENNAFPAQHAAVPVVSKPYSVDALVVALVRAGVPEAPAP